jgi:hypothetical protein
MFLRYKGEEHNDDDSMEHQNDLISSTAIAGEYLSHLNGMTYKLLTASAKFEEI